MKRIEHTKPHAEAPVAAVDASSCDQAEQAAIVDAIDEADPAGPLASEADAARDAAEAKIARMGTETTFKLLLEFSIPALAGVAVQMLYNIIDAVFVGHAVGANGLAATTVANPFMMAMVAIAMLVGVGGNALCAIRLGEARKGEAERVMGNSFTLLLAASFLIWAITALALEPILRLTGADDVIMPYAVDFVVVLVAACPLQSIAFGMNNFIRTAGHPNRALGSMLIGTACNVVLGYLFIVVFQWGMRGAGLATALSWLVSAVFVMEFFLRKGSPMPLRRRNLAVSWRIGLKVVVLGIAPAVTELGFAVSAALENNLLSFYGAADPLGVDGALAVMRVLASVGMITFMPSMGIATGVQPLIGYNYGAKNYARMKRALFQAIGLGAAISTPLWLSVIFFPNAYAGLFGLPQEYMAETGWALILYLMFTPVLAIPIIGSNYFDATGQAVKATVLTLTRQILFLIPLLIVCPQVLPSFTPLTPVESVWFAPSISDLTSTIVVGAFLLVEFRRLRKLERQAGV